MRKLLLLGLVVLGTACQKNYYLDDLNEANETIEQLEATIADLRIEIADANEVVSTQNTLLIKAQEDLDNLQAEYTYVNESQSAFIHELNAKIEEYITTIAELEAELVELNAYTQQVLENYTYEVISLRAQITELQAEIAAYEPEIVEVIKEVQVIVEVEKVVIEYVELNPEITALGLPDILVNGAAIFNRTDLDVNIGDTLLLVDYITGEEQYTDVQSISNGTASTTLIFTENIIVTSQIVIFKVTH